MDYKSVIEEQIKILQASQKEDTQMVMLAKCEVAKTITELCEKARKYSGKNGESYNGQKWVKA